MAIKITTIFQLIGICVCSLILCLMVPNTMRLQSYPATYASTMSKMYPTVVVKNGDSISGLSQQYNLPWQGVYCANERVIGHDPNTIQPGMTLTMKSSSCPQYSGYKNTTDTITAAEYTTTGSPKQIAWGLLANFGGGRPIQYLCLNNIIMSESSWSVTAANPSGAYGIPQALPGSKMGPGWEYSAYVQLYWMIKKYIPDSYGTPCQAWAFHEIHGWY